MENERLLYIKLGDPCRAMGFQRTYGGSTRMLTLETAAICLCCDGVHQEDTIAHVWSKVGLDEG
jgi:hypothetical protein